MTLDYTFDRQLELEREDSRAEGRAEGRAESVICLLERMGTVPEEIKQTIRSVTDMGVLESLLILAVRTESMEDFIREMTGKDS